MGKVIAENYKKHKYKIWILGYLIIYTFLILLIQYSRNVYWWVYTIKDYLAPGATLFVLLVTIIDTRKIQEENRKRAIEPLIDISCPPFIMIEYSDNNEDILNITGIKIPPEDTYNIDKHLNESLLEIVNISNNTAKNIELSLEVDLTTTIEKLKYFEFSIKSIPESPEFYNINGTAVRLEGYKDTLSVERHLFSNNKTAVSLELPLKFELKNHIKCLLSGYANNLKDEISKNDDGFIVEKENILQINVVLKYEDMENQTYSKYYTISLNCLGLYIENSDIYIDINIQEEKG